MINGENRRGRGGMMPMAGNEGLKARNQAVRPQVAGSACVAAMLLLLVPLLTLEADARGGGGGFGGRGAAFGGGRSFGVTRIGGASFGHRSLGVTQSGTPSARTLGVTRICRKPR